MDELGIQSDLIRAARDVGGFGVKLSHRFIVGVVDLLIQLPGLPTALIEVKFDRVLTRSRVQRLALTPHQRAFILNVQGAGGHSGWVLAVQVPGKPGGAYLACGTDSRATRATVPQMERMRGGPWPVREIVERITLHSS